MLALCLVTSSVPVYGDGVTAGFTIRQLLSPGDHLSDISLSRALLLDDVFYALGDNRTIYSWKAGAESVEEFYVLSPLPPEIGYISYDDLSDSAVSTLNTAVTHLASGDGELWGINLYTGRMGAIRAGREISWIDAAFYDEDLMRMQRMGGDPEVKCFIRDGALRIFMNDEILVWDDVINDKKAISLPDSVMEIIPYRDNKAVFSAFAAPSSDSSYSMGLFVADLEDGSISPYPGRLLGTEKNERPFEITGLAYNDVSDTLYYRLENPQSELNGMLASSSKEGDFLPRIKLPEMYGESYSIDDDTYAVQDHGGAVYVFDLREDMLSAGNVLRMKGMFSEVQLLSAWREAYPFILIDNRIADLEEQDILDIMLGDGNIDIYAIFANRLYRSAADKGYAFDLRSSDIIRSSAAQLIPSIYDTLHNQNGAVTGYPTSYFGLQLWMLDKAIWRECFGQRPYPKSFIEMFDVMREWEVNFSDQYDGVNVYGFFQLPVLLWEMVYQYVADYETKDQPIDFSTPMFADSLAAFTGLVRAVDTDRFDYNQAQAADSLFSGGGIIVGNNPILLSGEHKNIELIVPPSFEEGVQSRIQANIVVLMVNAKSQKTEEAMKFIEFISQEKGYDPVTGAVLNINDRMPAETEYYLTQKKETDKQLDRLSIAVESADEGQKQLLQQQIDRLKHDLDALSENRWIITQEGLDAFEEWEDRIYFTSNSIYISQNDLNNPFYQAVTSLCFQLTDGAISEESFIKSMNDVCKKIYYEQ